MRTQTSLREGCKSLPVERSHRLFRDSDYTSEYVHSRPPPNPNWGPETPSARVSPGRCTPTPPLADATSGTQVAGRKRETRPWLSLSLSAPVLLALTPRTSALRKGTYAPLSMWSALATCPTPLPRPVLLACFAGWGARQGTDDSDGAADCLSIFSKRKNFSA